MTRVIGKTVMWLCWAAMRAKHGRAAADAFLEAWRDPDAAREWIRSAQR
jgi:hypothetical protein